MKKLIQYLKQIDPRITVEVNIEEEIYHVSAGIENAFTCSSSNSSFRKAKKQFFKGHITLALAKEVAYLHAMEQAEQERKNRIIKEQEELLAKEFELLLEQSAQEEELKLLLEYIDKQNEIRTKVDIIKGLK